MDSRWRNIIVLISMAAHTHTRTCMHTHTYTLSGIHAVSHTEFLNMWAVVEPGKVEEVLGRGRNTVNREEKVRSGKEWAWAGAGMLNEIVKGSGGHWGLDERGAGQALPG